MAGRSHAHLLGEGELAVLGLLMLKVRGRVIAGPIGDGDIAAIHFHGQVSKRAIAGLVGGVEAKDVIGLGVVLHLLEGGAKVVGVEEGFAAGVAAEGVEGFLRGGVGGELRSGGRTGVSRVAAQAAFTGVADGGKRLQAPGIDAVDGEVGLGGLIGSRAQAGLVLDAVAGEAAGEIEHGLALIDALQALGNGTDGEQFAVGVEAVVFGIVGGERGGVVAGAVGRAGAACREAGRIRAVVFRETVEQGGLVGGEVLVHGEAGGHADESDEVGGRDLLVHVVGGRVDGAVDVFVLHGAEVEEEDDEAMVAKLLGVRGEVALEEIRDGCLPGNGGLLGEHRSFIDVLVVEADDVLRLLVFDDGKVAGLEAFDDGAGFLVANDDVGEHDVGVDIEREGARAGLVRCGRRRRIGRRGCRRLRREACRVQSRQHSGRDGCNQTPHTIETPGPQNLYLACTCTERMAAALVTSPNVREFSTTLIPLYWTVLKTLVAVTRASKERVSLRVMVRDKEALVETVPGPSMEPGEAEP